MAYIPPFAADVYKRISNAMTGVAPTPVTSPMQVYAQTMGVPPRAPNMQTIKAGRPPAAIASPPLAALPSQAQAPAPVTGPTVAGSPLPAAGGGGGSPAPMPESPPQAGATDAGGAADLQSLIGSMSTEELKAFLSMGDLERQYALAAARSQAPQLRGQYVSNGRIYVADSPLAHAVRAWGVRKAKSDMRDIAAEETAQKAKIAQMLLGNTESLSGNSIASEAESAAAKALSGGGSTREAIAAARASAAEGRGALLEAIRRRRGN